MGTTVGRLRTRRIKTSGALALSAALFLSSLAAFPWLELGHEVSQLFAFRAVGGAIALYILINGLLSAPGLRLNRLDVAVSGYSAYALLRILTNPYLSWYTEHTLAVGLLLASYFFFRTFLRYRAFRRGTLGVLLVVPLAQVVIGVLQKVSYLPAWHDTFRVSGTFFNPAPYAGFLVSVLPIALAVSAKTQRTLRYLGMITTVGILLILPVTASRAAWLGAVVGVAVWLNHHWAVGRGLRRKARTSLARTAVAAVALLLGGGLLIALFYIRPASALSRLLTWKVSASIISDYPLWGVSYDQFFAYFGQYQAQYFQRFPDDPLSSLAGQGEYAFNMFVELAVEQGLVGLALFLLMVTIALRATRTDDPLVVAAGASVVAILVFGFFSYPLAIIPIQINLFFCLALISGRGRCQTVTNRLTPVTTISPKAVAAGRCTIAIGAIGLLLFSGYHGVKRYQAYRRWKTASAHKDLFNYQDAIPVYERIYPVLRDNGKFLFQYGQTLSYEGEHRQAIAVLEKAKQRTTDTYLYTTLGESYQVLGQYARAEEVFRLATYHNPYRFYPRYLMAQLYLTTGRSDQAVAVARDIMKMDIKVPSARIDRIRKEMQALIRKHP